MGILTDEQINNIKAGDIIQLNRDSTISEKYKGAILKVCNIYINWTGNKIIEVEFITYNKKTPPSAGISQVKYNHIERVF